MPYVVQPCTMTIRLLRHAVAGASDLAMQETCEMCERTDLGRGQEELGSICSAGDFQAQASPWHRASGCRRRRYVTVQTR